MSACSSEYKMIEVIDFEGYKYIYRKDHLFDSVEPICLESTAPTIQPKKQETQNKYRNWEDEAIRLAKSRRYKTKLDICRAIKKRIDLNADVSFTAEHICRSITISAAEFKNIIKTSR